VLVQVPDVVGRKLNSAVNALTDRGFGVNVKSTPVDKNDGEIVRQDPAGRSRAPEGSTVTIWVGVKD